MLIDGFAHFLPEAYRRAMLERLPDHPALANWKTLEALRDVRSRLALMDSLGVDRQAITTNNPPLEQVLDEETGAQMARLANDSMAEVVAAHPDRFYGVASVCLLDPGEAARELERSVKKLGLVGAQIYSNVHGRPLSDMAFEPFWAKAAELDVPLWLHPARAPSPEADEISRRHSLDLVFGWPYDTTLAMSQLVLGGTMARHPRLKIIVHHAGAMMTFCIGRVEMLFEETLMPDGRPAVDGFRQFYVDSVTWGSTPALVSAMHAFGASHIVMGSDAPFGPRAGETFLKASIQALDALPVPPAEREAIASGNLLRLMNKS